MAPPTTWSVTGKRGRKHRPVHEPPEPLEQDVARFLLSLSSPSPSASPLLLLRGEAEDAEEAEGKGRNRRRRGRSRGTPPETKWRPRAHECSLCPRRFRTGRALGGHMKNHWERDLNGRVVKKKMRKISSLGFNPGLGFTSKPQPPPSPLPDLNPLVFSSLEAEEGEEDDAGDSLEAKPPPSPLQLPS